MYNPFVYVHVVVHWTHCGLRIGFSGKSCPREEKGEKESLVSSFFHSFLSSLFWQIKLKKLPELMVVEDRWSNISKLLDYTHFEAIVFLNLKKFQLFQNFSVDIRFSVLLHIKPGCWPLYHRWNVRSRGNMGPYSFAKTLTNVMQHVTAWYSSDWCNCLYKISI